MESYSVTFTLLALPLLSPPAQFRPVVGTQGNWTPAVQVLAGSLVPVKALLPWAQTPLAVRGP